MTKIWAGVKSGRRPDRLEALAGEARRGLQHLNFPAANWVLPRNGPEGQPMTDVLVVGGGMCGQTIGYALMRSGVRNFRVLDRNATGSEGPWGTYARMDILRSPKHLTGPDLGVPALTFRAWYEAQHGAEGWEMLHKAGRIDWRDYLLWVRETVGVPVENGCEVLAIAPGAEAIYVAIKGPAGRESLFARKVVLAGGRDGSGAPRIPDIPGLETDAGRAGTRVFHSADDIAFGRFKGGRLAVLGNAASAFDCAATALEAGVPEVILFARRPHLPQVNKSKWASFPGFFSGYASLDDATRWGIYSYILAEQVPPPYESALRCDAHAGFSIRFGEPWRDVVPRNDGVTVTTAQGRYEFDAVVLGTGFDVDLSLRPELATFRDNIEIWGDRMPITEAAANPDCVRFPYLGPGFELRERAPGATPGLANVHVFNWGSTLSHGALAGDIPGLATGVNRLADALCRDLFAADIDRHRAALAAHNDDELQPTARYIPPDRR